MGNRTYVVFENEASTEFSPAIYVQWNGGADSIYAFLKALDDYKCRKTDLPYTSARFCQIIANFFGGTLSIGLENVCNAKDLEKLMPGDNGLFVFAWIEKDKDWRCRRMSGFDSPKWLTEEQVKTEYRAARKSQYWTGEHPIHEEIKKQNDSHFNGRQDA